MSTVTLLPIISGACPFPQQALKTLSGQRTGFPPFELSAYPPLALLPDDLVCYSDFMTFSPPPPSSLCATTGTTCRLPFTSRPPARNPSALGPSHVHVWGPHSANGSTGGFCSRLGCIPLHKVCFSILCTALGKMRRIVLLGICSGPWIPLLSKLRGDSV